MPTPQEVATWSRLVENLNAAANHHAATCHDAHCGVVLWDLRCAAEIIAAKCMGSSRWFDLQALVERMPLCGPVPPHDQAYELRAHNIGS